jgi:hypothetical protein
MTEHRPIVPHHTHIPITHMDPSESLATVAAHTGARALVSNVWSKITTPQLRTSTTGRSLELFPKLTQSQRTAALEAMYQVIGTRWAPSTTTNQAYRTQALFRFLEAQGTTFRAASTEDLLVYLGYKFLQHRKASTLREYINTLSHLRSRLGRDLPPSQYDMETLLLQDVKGGLKPLSQDPDQSIPVDPSHWASLELLPPQLRCAVRICLKTASRVDEVLQLTPDQIVTVGWTTLHPTVFQLLHDRKDPQTVYLIAVLWGAKTKSSRVNRFREDMTTLIATLNPELWSYLSLNVTHDQPIFSISAATLQQVLSHFNPNYTLHSLKKTSHNHLWKLAAEGIVDPKVIPLVAKHRRDVLEVPDTNVRYNTVEGCINMARALGIAHATLALPW